MFAPKRVALFFWTHTHCILVQKVKDLGRIQGNVPAAKTKRSSVRFDVIRQVAQAWDASATSGLPTTDVCLSPGLAYDRVVHTAPGWSWVNAE